MHQGASGKSTSGPRGQDWSQGRHRSLLLFQDVPGQEGGAGLNPDPPRCLLGGGGFFLQLVSCASEGCLCCSRCWQGCRAAVCQASVANVSRSLRRPGEPRSGLVPEQPLLLRASVSPPGRDATACTKASLVSEAVGKGSAKSEEFLPRSLGAVIAALGVVPLIQTCSPQRAPHPHSRPPPLHLGCCRWARSGDSVWSWHFELLLCFSLYRVLMHEASPGV